MSHGYAASISRGDDRLVSDLLDAPTSAMHMRAYPPLNADRQLATVRELARPKGAAGDDAGRLLWAARVRELRERSYGRLWPDPGRTALQLPGGGRGGMR